VALPEIVYRTPVDVDSAAVTPLLVLRTGRHVCGGRGSGRYHASCLQLAPNLLSKLPEFRCLACFLKLGIDLDNIKHL
jgi:hypothetical protein